MSAMVAGTAAPAAAVVHDHGVVGPDTFWTAWSLDVSVVAGLVVLAVAYAAGTRDVWRAAGRGRALPYGRAACFAAGWLTLVVALVSPVDALAEGLFAAHMVQHLLLVLVAGPLLVLGAPLLPLLRSVPAGPRRALATAWNRSGLRRLVAGRATRPAVAWTAATLVLWLWHVPVAYEAALAHDVVHALEHATLLGTGILFWWVVLAPPGLRRLESVPAVLYLAGAAIQGAALGALLLFSTTPWYETQSGAAAAWGLSALEDQQLAGAIMWVPPALIYLGFAARIFLDALSPARTTALIALLALGVAGCSDRPERQVPLGDPEEGRGALALYGCGACHVIPGVREAEGTVGPPLTQFGRRTYIAGRIYNVPPDLITWIMDPTSVDPRTAMPDLGVTEADARDMAAYLYTLR